MGRTYLVLILFIFLCMSNVCSQNDIDNREISFEQFKKKFSKSYSSKEQVALRKANFQKNVNLLKSINFKACQITVYFDLSDKELQTSPTSSNLVTGALSTYPAILDWRANGRLTPVKNQGNCGSCWAFAVIAFFESEVVRTRGVSRLSLDLSEQYLLKCDTISNGCNGGYISSATQTAIMKGLPVQSRYPYSPKKNYIGICKSSPDYTFSGVQAKQYSSQIKLSDEQIIAYLQDRPIIIGVTATYWYMYSFATNRTYSCRLQESYSSSTLNHAVLLVGYTETEWIVKNSWGTSYGDAGYIYVSRAQDANCGIGFSIMTIA